MCRFALTEQGHIGWVKAAVDEQSVTEQLELDAAASANRIRELEAQMRAEKIQLAQTVNLAVSRGRPLNHYVPITGYPNMTLSRWIKALNE